MLMDKSFYIYGAGIVATSLYTAIKKVHNAVPIAFVVSDTKDNPPHIDGIQVIKLSDVKANDNACRYLIATPEVHHAAIAESLCKAGISGAQIIFADNQLENRLLEKYYSGEDDFGTVLSFIDEAALDSENERHGVIDEAVFVAQAKCHVDKPLKELVQIPDFIHPIQVGATFTDQTIADLKDDEGINISHKNRNYCELTATYYMWKNSQSQYKGLCHYRRIFDINSEQMDKLISGNVEVDVILPYPSVHYPDISGQHCRYVSDGDWNAMLQALREVAPEYYGAYCEEISKQQYFYNYNMLIARKEVFDDYCNWMFPILQRTEELSTPKGSERSDRYIGYLGENLTTLYFMKNKDKLKIALAGRLMLV